MPSGYDIDGGLRAHLLIVHVEKKIIWIAHVHAERMHISATQ